MPKKVDADTHVRWQIKIIPNLGCMMQFFFQSKQVHVDDTPNVGCMLQLIMFLGGKGNADVS